MVWEVLHSLHLSFEIKQEDYEPFRDAIEDIFEEGRERPCFETVQKRIHLAPPPYESPADERMPENIVDVLDRDGVMIQLEPLLRPVRIDSPLAHELAIDEELMEAMQYILENALQEQQSMEGWTDLSPVTRTREDLDVAYQYESVGGLEVVIEDDGEDE